MKTKQGVVAVMIALACMAANPAISASITGGAGNPPQMVVTVLPSSGARPQNLETSDLTVRQNKIPARVTRVDRLTGDMADMQLFVLLDDSTRSSSLGLQLPELKTFLKALPATTQVAVGYMRNGTFNMSQSFTADHQKAAGALRLPVAIPGENGSPYFALTDLVKHWPSKQPTGRRAVLMLTDGVDRYYNAVITDDPYVDQAMHTALKNGVMVYSIYLRGAGSSGRGIWSTNMAQSRLLEVSEETGGYTYFEGLSDPVSISPFLKDLQDRFDHQYLVTVEGLREKGIQPVKVGTESHDVKVSAPTFIYVP